MGVKIPFFVRFIFFRTLNLLLTLFLAVSIIFLLLRLMPAYIVDAIIAGLSQSAQAISPEDFVKLRETLHELFGLGASPTELYLRYLYRFFTLDFGPSMLAFPTPVKEIIARSLPWTVGLLSLTVIISWTVGNLLGTITSFYERRHKNISKILQGIAVTLYPIPYYILALVLVFLFVYLIPVFPLSGPPKLSLENIPNIIRASVLPALSIILISAFGWWFLSSRALTLNALTEDYVLYAELRGLDSSGILRKYVFRNVLPPQVTALSLSLGSIFNGALLTEIIFAYPGLGFYLYRAVITGDYSTAIGILSLSIIAISLATYIMDLIYPLIDPRIRYR